MTEAAFAESFRRIDDQLGIWARLRGGRRRYEVALSDGSRRHVTFSELDSLLKGRRHPADFWACVHAADHERDHLGDHEQPTMTVWPNGKALP